VIMFEDEVSVVGMMMGCEEDDEEDNVPSLSFPFWKLVCYGSFY